MAGEDKGVKRRIAELRRVLLLAEKTNIATIIDDDSGAEHAHLLVEGGYIRANVKPPDYVMLFGLTDQGCDLLAELRDERLLAAAMAEAEHKIGDADNLAVVRAIIRRERDLP